MAQKITSISQISEYYLTNDVNQPRIPSRSASNTRVTFKLNMAGFNADMTNIDASSTDKESLVQQVYDKYLSSVFGPTQRQNKCDAFYSYNIKTEQKEDTVRLLCEYKYNLNFQDRTTLAKVIVQVISYLRKFQQTTIAPSTILIGDLNEVVIFHSNWLIKYTNFPEVDWKVAASSLATSYPDLLKAVMEDEAFESVFTDVIKFSELETFNFGEDVVQKIIDLTLNTTRKVAINSGNIHRFAEYFKEKVIADAKFKLDSKKMAAALYQTIIGDVSEVVSRRRTNTQAKPEDKLTKKVQFGNNPEKVLVHSMIFDKLMNSLESEYSKEELKDLTGVFDRLIEDTQRRRDGKFYTPAHLCEAARAYADKYLGEDWRTRGIVWDNSCLSSDTQYFSKEGWKDISSYNGEEILQYNNGRAEFVKPLRYIRRPYTGKWIELNSSILSIKTTEDHDWVVSYNNHNDTTLFKLKAIEIYNKALQAKNTHLRIPRTFEMEGTLHLEKSVIQVAVAINADGCYRPGIVLNNNKNRTKRGTRYTAEDTSQRNCYCVQLKKERKIRRLTDILKNYPYKYRIKNKGKTGYVSFIIEFPLFDAKHFPYELVNLDQESKSIFINELCFWDGSIYTQHKFKRDITTRRFYTNKKQDADIVQFLVESSNDFSSNIYIDTHRKNTSYVVSIKNKDKFTFTNISGSNNELKAYDAKGNDECFCFTVPSGMLILRRNNKIFISGNCGTCNLTKGVYFSELYVSTLDQEELDAAELSKSIDHRFTTAFQYDFLNDPYEKLPEKLRLAIENGVELTFFCNPPYARAGGGTGTGSNKDAVSRNHVLEEMKTDGFQCDDILCQFLYKMIKYRTKVNIVMFGKSTWITGHKFKHLRDFVNSKMNFKGGFIVSSKEFSGNDGNWPVILSILSMRPRENTEENMYVYDLEDKKYLFYNTNGIMLNDYAKIRPNKEDLIAAYPYTSDGLTINSGDNSPHDYTYKNAIGSIASEANSRNGSIRGCCLWSMPDSHLKFKGFIIYPENFIKCCEVFTARVLSKPSSYLTDREEYSIPNFNDPEYSIFSAASLIMAIFMPEAKSTSVELGYKGNHFVIKNHFFWLTKLEFQKQVMDLEPLEGEPDETPYMVTALHDMIQSLETNEHLTDEGINIVNQGLNIIDQATELLKDSYPYRDDFAIANPVLQLQHWDAGYKQLKPFWEGLSSNNAEFKVKYDKFKNDFVAFKKAIKPMVWTFGFLKGEPEE